MESPLPEVEAEHHRAKGLLTERLQGWEDYGARTAVSVRYTLLPTPGEVNLWQGDHSVRSLLGLNYDQSSSDTSALLSWLLHTTQQLGCACLYQQRCPNI